MGLCTQSERTHVSVGIDAAREGVGHPVQRNVVEYLVQ